MNYKNLRIIVVFLNILGVISIFLFLNLSFYGNIIIDINTLDFSYYKVYEIISLKYLCYFNTMICFILLNLVLILYLRKEKMKRYAYKENI